MDEKKEMSPEEALEQGKVPTKRRKAGRPKAPAKRPRGRPKGEGAIMKEYRERMLNSPKSRKVLDAILNAALDDEHKHQSVAWKIIADRILPISSFDLDKNNGKPTVNISITGIGESSRVSINDNDVVDGEFEEYDSSEEDGEK